MTPACVDVDHEPADWDITSGNDRWPNAISDAGCIVVAELPGVPSPPTTNTTTCKQRAAMRPTSHDLQHWLSDGDITCLCNRNGPAHVQTVPIAQTAVGASPQQRTAPSSSRAQVCIHPASSCATTPTGTSPAPSIPGLPGTPTYEIVSPYPSWPRSFDPQHRTRPPETSAHECDSPAATAVAVVAS